AVPGQRPADLRGQSAGGGDDRVADGQRVPAGQRHQDEEPGGPLDQRRDRGLAVLADHQSGSPGALLRRGPLRTARAAFTASSSSKPRDGPGLQCCASASAGLVLALAGGVRKAGGVLARRARSSVMDYVVSDYRLPGDLQPPAFPFVGRLGWLIGGEQLVPAEGAA